MKDFRLTSIILIYSGSDKKMYPTAKEIINTGIVTQTPVVDIINNVIYEKKLK
jgi:hypothetical protein